MKAVLITSNDLIATVDVSKPLHKSVGELVGGFIEVVRPINMNRPYVMICNEDYCALELPFNYMGSYFYGTKDHGHPVLGNIVIMKEQGEDLIGLSNEEIQIVTETCGSILSAMKFFMQLRKGGQKDGEQE